MTLIEPRVELIAENNPLKKIEIAGRTCYKSEANITDESAKKFFRTLAKNSHMAMLEHAIFVFQTYREDIYLNCKMYKYFNCTEANFVSVNAENNEQTNSTRYIISANLRAILESGNMYLICPLYKHNPDVVYLNDYSSNILKEYLDCVKEDDIKVIDLNDVEHVNAEEIDKHVYTTMRFTCDRGVTHEIVRHRPFSFAQESTRYVNYSKEQNGAGDIKFITPADYNSWNEDTKNAFKSALECSEKHYNKLIENGRVAQEARAVLPNAVKTEIVITGNHEEWTHFFNLRSFGTTGKPHPDMKKVADMALEIYPVEIIRCSDDFQP